MTDTTVKYFASTMSGAPTLTGEAGKVIGVLDACLKDGFGSVTLTSLVVDDDIATGTVSGGHNFALVDTVGPVIEIGGATPSGLNGQWRIASIPGTTTFTFATSGISNQTATGTITAKRAALGFTKPYSGTNKAVYQCNDVTSTQLYLRVDNTSTSTSCRARGYETMSDVDTGTGLFPTDAQLSGGLYIHPSSSTNSTARAWILIGDNKHFYLFCEYTSNGKWSSFYFGDFNSYKSSDAYGCHILGHIVNTVDTSNIATTASTSGRFIARSYTGSGGSLAPTLRSHALVGATMGRGAMSVPNPVDNGYYFAPVDIWESTSAVRGLLPGFYAPFQVLSHGSFVSGVPEIDGRTLWIQQTEAAAGAAYLAFDITGPWR